MSSARRLVEEVLSRDMTRAVWTGNFDKVLPFAVQRFELSAILPAVFYMFRFGHRRGKGKFLDIFAAKTETSTRRRQSATIDRVSEQLARSPVLEGFDGEVQRAVLGDLLLCFCLENVKQSLGRDKQIQRVMPAHYMASWVDLPVSISDLRSVPEMIVALLADQKGDQVKANGDGDRTHFAVGRGYEDNVLLRAFSQGVVRRGNVLSDLASDGFNEEDESVGLDQMLMIRLALQLRAAPEKMRGKDGVSIANQRPIAENAAQCFSEDIRRFVRSYADPTPRQVLVEMLESCIAVGMTTILTSTVEMLFSWTSDGKIPDRQEQRPACLFVDCSNGIDQQIGARSEQSMDDFMRRMERFPVTLMVLRLLDYEARNNLSIKKQNIRSRPYATAWLNLLGELLHDQQHPQSQRVHLGIGDKAEKLAEKLSEEDYTEVSEILSKVDNQPNAVLRLADGLTALMGSKSARSNLMNMVDSILLTGRPNGLATKRTTTRGVRLGEGATRRRREVRSIVFTDSVLDYLVHLHLLKSGGKSGVRALSYSEFIGTLRDRYGFYIDSAPPGMTISNELLQRNRAILERRVRDLGLLVGVNDAEAMKRLRPRFDPTTENQRGMD